MPCNLGRPITSPSKIQHIGNKLKKCLELRIVGRSDAEAILEPQLVNQPTLVKEQPSSQRRAEAAVPGRGRTGKGEKGPVVWKDIFQHFTLPDLQSF